MILPPVEVVACDVPGCTRTTRGIPFTHRKTGDVAVFPIGADNKMDRSWKTLVWHPGIPTNAEPRPARHFCPDHHAEAGVKHAASL